MEREVSVTFNVSYLDDPERVEGLRKAVVARCGLSIEDIETTSAPELIRYLIDSQNEYLLSLGVTIHDSHAEDVTPEAVPTPAAPKP